MRKCAHSLQCDDYCCNLFSVSSEYLQLGFSMDDQELDNNLRVCKDEFKEFENQDIKYREDLKHKKQKIKKVEEKLEKVGKK